MKHRFQRTTVTGLLTALLTTAAMGQVLAPGDPAPPILAKDLTGRTWRAQWADHELTIVNFWATWCDPCVKEMPALQDLQDRLRDRGLLVVGVLARDAVSDRDAHKFVEDLGVTYPTIRG
ncbi:MAG: TlpA disulfide reductase family protein, partial [Acidobacteriota bacterium]|nr:TlpA disulfide reductase family protein [Acidobacteriota bacterium]